MKNLAQAIAKHNKIEMTETCTIEEVSDLIKELTDLTKSICKVRSGRVNGLSLAEGISKNDESTNRRKGKGEIRRELNFFLNKNRRKKKKR